MVTVIAWLGLYVCVEVTCHNAMDAFCTHQTEAKDALFKILGPNVPDNVVRV